MNSFINGANFNANDFKICSRARPEDKATIIEKLQSQGRKVLFVGDGTNDAPAIS